MVKHTISRLLLAVGVLFGMSSMAFAGDAPKTITGASAGMLADACACCHGTDGASNGPASPSIAGLSPEYFKLLMTGFKSGEIYSTIMGRIAKGYSKDEIALLAKYYGAKKFTPAKQDFDKKLAAKGAKIHDKYCEKCHEDGGTVVEDDTGRLAGQWAPYLHAAMKDFISEKREMTRKMKKRVMKLHTKKGDVAFDALIAYYASQQ